jgi:hypothetical protein
MKNLFFLIVLLFTSALSFSQVFVTGYYRSNGTYVQPYQRMYPNSTIKDIYDYQPPAVKVVTVAKNSVYDAPTTYTKPITTYIYPTYSTPMSTYSTPSYDSSQTIYTGSRGGQYYINSNGNKSYISN